MEPQEIRNALFQGNSTRFLKECASMQCFITATGGSVKSERMLDREFVLRYVSFCYLNLDHYTGNIDDFLNLGMKFLNRATEDELVQIEENFKFVMVNMYQLMERDTFRKICSDGRRRPINKVIFESWCYVMRNLAPEDVVKLIERRQEVRQKYMGLCENLTYLSLLKSSDKKAVLGRIECIKMLIESVLEIENDKKD